MVHLTLAGLSQDKARLVLVSDAGVEFTLDIDARLRAALRGDVDRLGQLEITMESTLRPRDIQARIRAGASPDEVARAGQTTVERIMGFVAPVLAERAHVAERAQSSSLRRRVDGSGSTGARTLGEAVAAHLGRERIPVDDVTWDAWRRDDGRWTLVASFTAPGRRGPATFAYDLRGNYVAAEDDAARWLIGEEPAAATTQRADDLQQARRRRASRVSVADALLELPLDDDRPDAPDALGDDAIALVEEPRADREPTVDLTDVADAVRRGEGGPAPDAAPEPVSEPAAVDEPEPGPASEPAGAAATELEPPARADEVAPVDEPAGELPDDSAVAPEQPEPQPEPPAPKRPARRRRASVPSWDEIMFGGGGGPAD